MDRHQKLRTFELISFILMIGTILTYVGTLIYYALTMYEYGSLPMSAVALIFGLGYVIPFVFFAVLFYIARRLEKKHSVLPIVRKSHFTLSKTRVKRISITLLVLCLISIGAAVTFQEKFLYFPTRSYYYEYRLEEIDEIKEVSMTEDDLTTNGYHRINSSGNGKVIIMFGGNAQNAASIMNYYWANDWFGLDDYDIVVMDYPTYGTSGGELTEDNIKKMSMLTYDMVHDGLGYDSENIILMGFSLGTGVASYVASKQDASKLILVAPYTSMTDIINTRLPIFYGPLEGLIRHQFHTDDLINSIDEDVYVFASRDDDVIPFKITEDLIEIIEPSSVWITSGLRHNDLLEDDELNEKLRIALED